jgi:plasmid stability protein
LAATRNADREQAALFALHYRSLENGLRDLLRKHLSGCVRTIHFELSTAHGRLYRCRLFVGEKLGLACTTSEDQQSNEREDYE